MRFVGYLFLPLMLAVPCSPAAAHPGGLNAEGCHNNRRTGDYHCHRNNTPRSTPTPRAQRGDGDTYYANCSEARAAGAAPIRRGQAGYRPPLDRDNDGIACERR